MATVTASPRRSNNIVKRLANDLPPAVDRTKMSARFTISTPTEDRSGDVVRPFGVKLANYSRNPVVMYDHGFGEITLPIGKSLAPGGGLAVYRSSKGIEADCYFSQSSLQSAQVFALVEEGILNCASVHLDPLKAEKRYTADGRAGFDIIESDLLEWSIVSLPCNPEALKKVLDRNRLAGRTIVEPLKKSLAESVENYLSQDVTTETPHQRLTRLESALAGLCEVVGAIGLTTRLGIGDTSARLQTVKDVIGLLVADFEVANVPPDGKALAALQGQLAELAALIDEFDAKKMYSPMIAALDVLNRDFLKKVDMVERYLKSTGQLSLRR